MTVTTDSFGYGKVREDGHGSQRSLLLCILDRWKVFAAAFIVVFALVMALLVLLPRTYQATGSVIVAEPETGLSLPPAGWAQKVGDPADIESQLLIIKSARMMQKLSELPQVRDLVRQECRGGGCADMQPGSPEFVDYLERNYAVDGAGRSRVINISYKSAVPSVARDMANALINTFLDDHLKGLTSGRGLATQEIRAQLATMDTDIRSLDDRIQAFRSERGLTSGSQAPITSERLSAVTQQLALAEADQSRAETDLREAESDLNREVPTSPLLLGNPSIAGLRQQIVAVMAEEQSLSMSLGPRHPRIRTLQSRAEFLREQLTAEIRTAIDGNRKQLATARARVDDLRRQAESARGDVSRAASDESSIEQLVRDVEVKRRQYAERAEQLNTLETEQQATLGSTRLVSLAETPVKAFFPKTLPFAVGGLLLAGIAGAAAALAVDFLPAIAQNRRREKAFRARGATFASLPDVGSVSNASDLATAQAMADEDPQFRKGLATIHAAVRKRGPKDKLNGIVVSSLFADENGTFAALALARHAASKGDRVLLVEANFHNPQIDRLLGLTARRGGLVDALAGDKEDAGSDLVRYEGVDIVSAGQPGQGDHDLVFSQAMMAFLERAKGYDLVIVDCPPVAGHMEGVMLSRDMKGLLLCSREGEGAGTLVSDVSGRLQRLGVTIVGTWLWGAQTGTAGHDAAETGARKLRVAS